MSTQVRRLRLAALDSLDEAYAMMEKQGAYETELAAKVVDLLLGSCRNRKDAVSLAAKAITVVAAFDRETEA